MTVGTAHIFAVFIQRKRYKVEKLLVFLHIRFCQLIAGGKVCFHTLTDLRHNDLGISNGLRPVVQANSQMIEIPVNAERNQNVFADIRQSKGECLVK